MVYGWINFVQQILYPSRCLLCGAAGDNELDLCTACAASLPYNRHPCRICALPLPSAAPVDSLCGNCLKKPPPYDRCQAPLIYGPNVSQLIGRLKFNGKLSHARLLSRLMIDYLEPSSQTAMDLLLPVPLHRQRLRERGYNQALEIARPLGRRFGIRIAPGICRRVAVTPTQTGLDRKARERNLRNAFQLRGDIQGLNLLLIDDVVTTGATVSELARCLKRAGAGRIEVWAAARTPRD